MATGVASWSKTAATNASSDSAVNFAEGQAPSSVNDSARGLMASVAKYRDDTAGTLTTGGTSTAYTLTTNQSFASLTALDGMELTVRFNATNGAAPTLAVDSLTAKPIQVSSTVAVGTGVILINSIWALTYDNSAGAFIMRGVPGQIQDATVATASIATSAVTYAKIQNVTTNRLLGNVSGSGAAPQEITIGKGLVVNSTTLTAPAFPPSAIFKNLSIKVASTTTVTVAADFVVTTDGTNYQTTALSGTVNLGTNGAANALDSGTIAIDTWYAIWAIAKSDGTTAALASTSFTSPTLPSGYTFKSRIGAVQTIHSTATLYGTWQFGRVSQYVVGLASTSALPVMASGNAGNVTTPTWVSIATARFVPSTASEIDVVLSLPPGGTGGILAAPNNSYGGNTSTTNPPPLMANGGGTIVQNISMPGRLVLESSNIYWAASNGANGLLYCRGWVDNI